MSPLMGLLPGRPTESLRSRLRRDRPDPVGRTSQIPRNPRTTFLAVDTVFLKRFYVLFFIELATRRVRLAGITTNPDGRWVSQEARNLLMQLDDEDARPRFLVRDRDSKFTREF